MTEQSPSNIGEAIPSDMKDSLRDMDAQNVLLLNDALETKAGDYCLDLMATETSTPPGVVHVTFTESLDKCLNRWQQSGRGLPRSIHVISAGETARSTASVTSIQTPEGFSGLTVKPISEPGNLTKLGVAITNALHEWDQEPIQPSFCFDSITTLLQYVDRQTAFRFLRETRAVINDVDGVGHYHADPAAHDERTLNTFKSVMDAMVEVDDEGTKKVTIKG